VVVAVSRRPATLAELFAGEQRVETAAADALDTGAIAEIVKGCELVVDCIGLPPERMADHPKTARVISDAARETGARCLQVSSYWSFFPHEGEVVNEDHPRRGGHEWFRLRREAEDVMLAAGAAVVHLPDFFGPHVHTSSVQAALEEAASGGPVHCLGRPDTSREAAFIPDAMRTVADLAERDEAYGTDWALRGSGPLSADRLAGIASEHLDRQIEVSAAPVWLLKVLVWVHPKLRAIRPIVPHYVRPVRYDTSKLRGLLGEVETTPFERAIPATLDWIGSR
jgi:nucleoside-diphosphate-sugar epimerase